MDTKRFEELVESVNFAADDEAIDIAVAELAAYAEEYLWYFEDGEYRAKNYLEVLEYVTRTFLTLRSSLARRALWKHVERWIDIATGTEAWEVAFGVGFFWGFLEGGINWESIGEAETADLIFRTLLFPKKWWVAAEAYLGCGGLRELLRELSCHKVWCQQHGRPIMTIDVAALSLWFSLNDPDILEHRHHDF